MGARTRAVLAVDEGPSPLFLRIARAVSDEVRRGRLKAREPLPGTRALAESLGVNRNTVVSAYRALVAEGWVVARPGGGTYVAESLPVTRARALARALRPESVAAEPHFPLNASALPELAPAFPRGTLVMAGGVPDVRLVPADLIARALRRALTPPRARDLLAYGDPRGDPQLRTAIANLVRETRGVPARPEEVLVVRGSQMALALVARAVVPAGGAIAVEALGYPPAWAAFRSAGARLTPIAVDARGIDVDALAAAASRERIRAVYVTPHHQYPTTVTMAPGRRIALLDLARRERLAIIEDDDSHELHYEGRPVLPLASADVHGCVVYVGTLSKVLAPGLRIGYLVAPVALVERLARERHALDRQGDHVGERAAAELIDDGTVARHVRRMRRVYAARRDLVVGLLRDSLGDRVEVPVPHGGMALWVRVRLPASKVLTWERRALAERVAITAGLRFAFNGEPMAFVRIGFASLDEGEARQAVARLARAFPR